MIRFGHDGASADEAVERMERLLDRMDAQGLRLVEAFAIDPELAAGELWATGQLQDEVARLLVAGLLLWVESEDAARRELARLMPTVRAVQADPAQRALLGSSLDARALIWALCGALAAALEADDA